MHNPSSAIQAALDRLSVLCAAACETALYITNAVRYACWWRALHWSLLVSSTSAFDLGVVYVTI